MHLKQADSSSYIGTPWLGDQLDRWLIPLSQPVRSATGELLGVVHVGISLDTFLDFFSNVLPSGITSVAIYHDDGRLLFSYPFNEDVIGRSLGESGLFKSQLPASSFGTYQAKSPNGGERRILSYRAISGVPAVVAVDSSLSNVLGSWGQRAIIYGLAALGASAVILALTLWLSAQYRRDEKTQTALLIKEQSLETSQRMAGIGYFVRDVSEKDFTWADNMYRIHGVSPESFTPDLASTLDLVVEEDRVSLRQKIQSDTASNRNGHAECRIRRPDGEIRNMVYDWQIIRDHDDMPIQVFGVAQDITNLKERENAIRENEARLRDITECISDFIWEGDENGALTLFETGTNDINLKVVLGQTRDENVDHETGGGDWSEILEAMHLHKPYRNLVVPFRNDDGETRWIRISGNPRFDQKGEFVGYRGAGSDVTETRQRHIANLEVVKSEALARLAGGMAHEINNILQPVVVYSSMGESESKHQSQTEGYFQKIYSATQQAMHIVKDVLTFDREGQAQPNPISLVSTLTESIELIQPTLTNTIIFNDPDSDIVLNVGAHANGMQRVVLNLLRNAADAAGPSGKILVDVGTIVLSPSDAGRRSMLPGRYGYFSVTDNEPGIADDVINKIFDPFFTTKPVGSGTGLGLSVVAGLVREWGGAVEVDGQPGCTKFTVLVPVMTAAQQAAE